MELVFGICRLDLDFEIIIKSQLCSTMINIAAFFRFLPLVQWQSASNYIVP